ncbi:hypothetical protein CUMW_035190 [Citrus unshiu]|nr:hypothetical protein CUMW_035190 [Citrus unshiu]
MEASFSLFCATNGHCSVTNALLILSAYKFQLAASRPDAGEEEDIKSTIGGIIGHYGNILRDSQFFVFNFLRKDKKPDG